MSNGKMEDMLSQLIKMVGTIQSDVQELKQEMHDLKQEMKESETKNEIRHKETLDRFKALQIDQDFIWEKTARNEREIGNMKRQLSQQ